VLDGTAAAASPVFHPARLPVEAQSVIPRMASQRVWRRLGRMTEGPPGQRVEVSFAGAAPVHRIRWSAGVSEVEAHGAVLRCLVSGSFQPFLEALRGPEVVSLTSSPARVGPARPSP
jgi:hypothetical protein